MNDEHCIHCGMVFFHCECELRGKTFTTNKQENANQNNQKSNNQENGILAGINN